MSHGGKRPGAGRKSYNISEREKKKLLSEARRKEKEEGKSIAEILLDIIYQGPPQMKLAAVRLYYELLIVKEGHKTIEEHKEHGIIILPEIRRPESEQELPKDKELPRDKEIAKA